MNKVIGKTVSFCLITIVTMISGCTNGGETSVLEQNNKFVINASEPIAEIQPTMYGVFFEDINFAADGGIYAEMIKNRSFEFDKPMMGWNQPNSDRHSLNEESGFGSVINMGDEIVNSHFLRVELNVASGYVLQNEGFRGMGVEKGQKYDLTILASQYEGENILMRFQLIDSTGAVLGESEITPVGEQWKTYSAVITSDKTEAKAQLNIIFEGKGTLDVDMISLFPRDTWMNRPKGLRKDLVQLLADLKPGFLRFPGGCIVEGSVISKRYQWKKTVGSIEEREVMINRWNTEFGHRLTDDYFQSFGLGFYEYFQLSEDLGAEPLPILSCGIACQFNSAELVPMDQLDPYIQDALDLIEFANGSTASRWGKIRADMGHPEPFDMKYIGVGNEQWGPEYIKRYKVFDAAIKAKYPDIIIVSGTGPFPDGEHFDYAMTELKQMDVDIIDEHYYKDPEWFLKNANRYDAYDRNGPKIFAGEYAAQSVSTGSPENENNWKCALSEAAFMTGLERNAEVVHLTSYAPLFGHAEGWQWTPDLIWFNNLKSYGTPNYYVQKQFSNNAGTHVLSLLMDGKPVTGEDGLYATAAKDVDANEIIIKLVNVSENAKKTEFTLSASEVVGHEASLAVLSSKSLERVNSFDTPMEISPVEKKIQTQGNSVVLLAAPYSLSVIRVPIK